MSPRLLPRILFACAALAAGRPALASWSPDPAQPLVVCDASGGQVAPAIVPDRHGGAFLLWLDGRVTDAIATEHVLASGIDDPALLPNGVGVCAVSGGPASPGAISDGAGGALVAWVDGRNFSTGVDVYASHILPSGLPDPAWTQDGVRIGGNPASLTPPVLATDALGGAFVAWVDTWVGDGTTHVRVARLLAAGTPDPAWTVDGRPVGITQGSQSDVRIVPDGGRGAFVAWIDTRPAAPGVYVHHLLPSGAVDSTWPLLGARVSTAVPPGAGLALVADGTGGALVAWSDPRDGNPHIYAHHVLQANGADPRWPAFGIRVSTGNEAQGAPTAVSDGAGGVVLAWEDQQADIDVYAQHVGINGAVDPAWPAAGVAVTGAALDQRAPQAVSDGAGGAIVLWSDHRDGADWAPFAQHVRATGAVDATWATDGARLAVTQEVAPLDAVVAPDGSGGAIATWSQWRGTTGRDIVAQRVDRYGKLGDPAPRVIAVQDVPGDQGGSVRIQWNASSLDLAGDSAVVAYEILATAESGGGISGTTIPAAHGTATYSAVVPTLADSTGADPALESFTVRARNAADTESWTSPPATGYSVDNLAPDPPAGLRGNYANQSTHLAWRPNREPDFARYRIYTGRSSSFVPGPESFWLSTPDTSAVAYGGGGTWFKLSAVDVHGNESAFAVLSPASIPGDPLLGEVVVFSAPRPNPARASTEFDYTLLRDGPASLAIYDARGQRVRRLVTGLETAGDHARPWDLRDDNGRALPTGQYYARFEAAGRTRFARITILR